MKYVKRILFILLFLIPLKVNAYVNYDITDFLVDATVLQDGNMEVKELIVLKGTFHGYVRDIAYRNSKLTNNSNSYSDNDIYNAKGITDVQTSAMKLETPATFQTFNEIFYPLTRVYFDSDAENGNYLETSFQDGKSYKMYYEGNNETVAFLITYKIESPVVIHNDVAELYWTFIGNGFEDEINNLQIKVHLPNNDQTDLFRFWAHGDITGNINKEDNQTIVATMKSLSKNNPVDLRITFDKEMITNQSNLNKVNEEALPKIIEVETKRAEISNEKRKTAKLIYNAVAVVSSMFLISLIIWWIYIYIRFDKEYKSNFDIPYYREFIDDYNVEVVDYLMKGTITSNAMAASILNLIYKKNIKVEEITENSKKKEYEFTLLNHDNTNSTEDVLLDFLFEDIGSNGKFTTKELDNYAKSTKTYVTFQTRYTNWLNCVKKDGEQQNFYEKNGVPIVSGIFILLVAILISFVVYYYRVDFILGYIVFPCSILYLIYSLMIKKRSKKGNEDYVRWNAFRKFLKDFGKFDTRELPEIILWERYLVYATVFGLADEVEKAMNTKIQEMPETQLGSYYYPTWIDMHVARSIDASVTSSIQNARITATREAANSQMSSGSGRGGGFSSGSGFGGGGGGGHGF